MVMARWCIVRKSDGRVDGVCDWDPDALNGYTPPDGCEMIAVDEARFPHVQTGDRWNAEAWQYERGDDHKPRLMTLADFVATTRDYLKRDCADRIFWRKVDQEDVSDIRAAYQAAIQQLDAATTLDEARAVTVDWPAEK